jgi:phosphoribosylanthranilate isomerase
MTVTAKICGLAASDAIAAAVAGGASHVGLNFYPPSPRYVTPARAASLVQRMPAAIGKVGVFVEPDDDMLATVLAGVALDMVQLHGKESAARVAEVRTRFAVKVMKTAGISCEADVVAAADYAGVADWLLFDARAPAEAPGALPGGNALAFDWRLLAGRRWSVPWMLAGGLDADNVAEAARVTGAGVVDVSSGVEEQRGRKSPVKIAAFLAAVSRL